MKGQAVLNVLIYLFKNQLQNKTASFSNELAQELEEAGFGSDEIQNAFLWLTKLDHQAISTTPLHHQPHSMRVFSDYELSRLSPDACGYLLRLEQEHILTPHLRETIINQALIFQRDLIDLNLLRWLTLMVLCNQVENGSDTSASLEFLTLEDTLAGTH